MLLFSVYNHKVDKLSMYGVFPELLNSRFRKAKWKN